MNKCSINDIADIQNEVKKGLRQAMRSDSALNIAKNFISNYLNEFSKNYELTDENINLLMEGIMSSIERFSIKGRKLTTIDSGFFNSEALINRLKNIDDTNKFNDNHSYQTTTESLEIPLSSIEMGLKGTEFIDKWYGQAVNVSIHAKYDFNNWIVNHTLLNRSTGKTITNNAELNREIRNLRQQLADNIYDYVKNLGEFKESDFKLYTVGKYNRRFEKVRQSIWELLQMSSDQLNITYTRAHSGISSEQAKLKAFNSYMLLTYLDDYIYSLYKNNIEIANYGTFDSQFRWAQKGAEVNKTWRTTDNIDPEKEVSGIIKLLVSTTPVYNFNTETHTDKYITFNDFQYVVKNIKDLGGDARAYNINFNDVLNLQLNSAIQTVSNSCLKLCKKYGNLANLINNIRFDAQNILPSVFELFSNKQFLGYLKSTKDTNIFENWTSGNFNNMYSMYRGIFNTNKSKELMTNSIFRLDSKLANDISHTVDNVTSTKFLQYCIDDDGTIKSREMLDLTTTNIQRAVEYAINGGNSPSLDIYDTISNTYKVDGSRTNESDRLFEIVFSVPNTGLFLNIDNRGKFKIARKENNEWKVFESIPSEYFELVKPFIQQMIKINTNDIDLMNTILEQYNNSNEDMYTDLTKFSSRILLRSFIQNKFLSNYTSPRGLKERLNDLQIPNRIDKKLGMMDLIDFTSDSSVLNNITNAYASLRGLTSSNTLKDGEGNTQNSASQSRLLGTYRTQWARIQQNNGVMSTSFLLTHPGAIKGIYNAKEFMGNTTVKPYTKFTISEQVYAQFVIDYIQQLTDSPQNKYAKVWKKNVIGILPADFSDKPNISRLACDLNTIVDINGTQKPLVNLTLEELQDFIKNEFNNIYIHINNQLKKDWNTLLNYFNIPVTADELFDSNFDYFNYNTDENGVKVPVSNPFATIQEMIRTYNKANRNHPLSFIDQVHYVYNNKANKLMVNQTLKGNLERWNSNSNSKLFWMRQHKLIARDLLSNNFSFDLSQGLSVGNTSLKYLTDTYPNWVDDSGRMIIAKDGAGKPIKTVEELQYANIVELHPELQRYNYFDFLFSEQFILSTVGSPIAHPSKYFGDNFEEDEALRYNAQNKRNVSFTAQMLEFTLNMVNGIPKNYNISIVKDISDLQYNSFGLTGLLKAWDGATFVHPAMVYLENNSLGTDAVGITKKPFFHYYNTSTSTGGIIKTAGFGLTNNTMRNSKLDQLMAKKMMNHIWLEESSEKLLNIDITKNYNGDLMSINGDVYFQKDDKYYKLLSINKTEGNNTYQLVFQNVLNDGSTQNTIVIDTAKQLNEFLHTDVFEVHQDDSPIIIDTNYKLYQILGGWDSRELINNKLIQSENSIKFLVDYINNIGIKKSNIVKVQNDVYQPLKVADIHYIATEGAVKQGITNINNIDDLLDLNTDLMYFPMEVIQGGVQLDKEHHADGSDLSLMTQVWNACALRGYSHTQAANLYKSLAQLSRRGTDAIIKAIDNYIVFNDRDTIREIVNKTLIKELANDVQTDNFATTIAKSIINKARKGEDIQYKDVLLPMSDNAIYAKLASTISVSLTRSGIKLKIPGILSIITPSFGRIKLYGGKKLSQWKPGELETKQKLLEQVPLVDQVQKNFVDVEIGRPYNIQGDENLFNELLTKFPEININQNIATIFLKTPLERNELKKTINNYTGEFKIYENILNGRDLAPMNYKFNYQTQDNITLRGSLFDLDVVNDLYILRTKDVPLQEKFHVAFKYNKNKYIEYLIDNNLLNNIPNENVTEDTVLNILQINNIPLYNEKRLLAQVQKEMDRTMRALSPNDTYNNYVYIDNKRVMVDKNSVQFQAYELGMNKTFAKEFGLEEDSQLSDILDDPFYFTKKLIRKFNANITNQNNFDIELKRIDGKHIYILDKSRVNKLQNVELSNIEKIYDEDTIYRTDYKGNKLYKLSSMDDQVYTDDNGNEIIVTEHPEFFINSLNYSNIIFSKNLNNDNIIELLNKFLNSNNKVAQSILKFYSDSNKQVTKVNEMLSRLTEINPDNINSKNINSFLKYNPSLKITITEGNRIYTSFKKSLEVIASRTPAQSLQSVMKMKIVLFDDPNLNTAFVNNAQLWLQGSDMDIDAVNLATYYINKSGKLPIWSPYADIRTEKSLNKSMELLPFPTCFTYEPKITTYTPELIQEFIDNTKDVLTFDEQHNPKINTHVPLESIAKTLQYEYKLPTEESRAILTQAIGITSEQLDKTFELLKQFIDKHNLYLNSKSNDVDGIIQNYQIFNINKILSDPNNLRQSQAPVDEITQEQKDITKNIPEAEIAKTEVHGNFVSKISAINRNMGGKDGVGICAAALKTFEGLSFYYNQILQHGTKEEQNNLLFDKKLYSWKNGAPELKTYNLLANCYTPDISTIKSDAVRSAYLSVDQTVDAALFLSAMLGLSADNAKELALYKLNAGPNMMGLYMYGAMIGVEFNDLAKTLMSPIARLCNELLEGNVFTNELNFSSLASIFQFLESGTWTYRFNKKLFNSNNQFEKQSPFEYVDTQLQKFYPEGLLKLLDNNVNPNYIYEQINKIPRILVSTDQGRYVNRFIDILKKYAKYRSILKKYEEEYHNLKILAAGSKETQDLGKLYKFNQGLPTKVPEIILASHNISNIYNGDTVIKTVSLATDQTFLTAANSVNNSKQFKFGNDTVTRTFNPFYAVYYVPHFKEYVQDFARLYIMNTNSAKFRFINNLYSWAVNLFDATTQKSKIKILKGLQNYADDYINNQFLLESGKKIIIPAGFKYYNAYGDLVENKTDMLIQLGTESGNATFKRWMDTQVFPNLKQGLIHNNTRSSAAVKTNEFIKLLTTTIFDMNTSHNSSINYGLNINMMPRTDNERLLFNMVKSEFNKLGAYDYKMTKKDSIPILELMALYNIVTYSNKIGQSTLTPIMSDIQNQGIFKELHDFEAYFDKEREIYNGMLNTDDIDTMGDKTSIDLLYYLSQNENTYTSKTKYIFGQDRNSFQRFLMKSKQKRKESQNFSDENMDDFDYSDIYSDEYNDYIEEDYGAEEDMEGNQVYEDKNYQKINPTNSSELNLNYFIKGFAGLDYTNVEELKSIHGRYSINESGKLVGPDPTHNGETRELCDIPRIKTKYGTFINQKLLDDIIQNYENPC